MEQQIPVTPEHEPTEAGLAPSPEGEQVLESQETQTISAEPTSASAEGRDIGLPSSVVLPTQPIKKREGKVDITSKGEIRFYATGRRKEAVARVWLIPGGTGQIIVNDRPLLDYLTRISLYEEVVEPFRVTNTLGMFDVKATAKGGGLHGQAGALRHGIARALVVWNEELRPILRRHGLLTRDPRAKERKKYGHKRARRGFQFRKR
ncbi:MAG: hypothetical protein OGMRLDGQ_001512 [Candidatus Fervidibacter sp.]|jgi:small subunit ribosomal protein S9